MLIEDVACPTDKLADMMIDLIDMFQRFGYHDASCFGHALEGNLHLVFAQVGCRRGISLRSGAAPSAGCVLPLRCWTNLLPEPAAAGALDAACTCHRPTARLLHPPAC